MMYFNKPKISIKITTRSGSKIELVNAEYGGLVLNYQREKSVSGPAGKFQFTIVNRPLDVLDQFYDWRDLVQEKPLVEIYINDVFQTIGTLQRVTKITSIQESKPNVSFQFSGVDLGELLKDTAIFYDVSERALENFKGTRAVSPAKLSIPNIKDKSIQNIIHVLWQEWALKVYKYADYRFADYSELADRIIVDKNYFADNLYVDSPSMFQAWNYGGDLFGAIMQLLSSPFHEIFGIAGGRNITLKKGVTKYLEPGKYYLILRPTPYDLNEDEDSILTMGQIEEKVYLDDSMIISKNLSATNEEMFSYYSLTDGGIGIAENFQRQIINPVYDVEALQKYGYKPLVKKINGITMNNQFKNMRSESGYLIELIQRLQKKMYNWYSINDQVLSGQFTCIGNPHAQEGSVLYYQADGRGRISDDFEKRMYYVQGLMQNYQFGKGLQTTYNVVRGVKANR